MDFFKNKKAPSAATPTTMVSYKQHCATEGLVKLLFKRAKHFFTCFRTQENLVESKHHKLARSLRSGLSDRDAKPNASVRDLLTAIVTYPSTKPLSGEEQDLVWKFRFYLSSQKRALTKFLKCVNWSLNGKVYFLYTSLKNI